MIVLADSISLPVSEWQNYYEIVGTSAAALIGVQFVVIALVSSLRRRTQVETINAFGTPTVVHFSVSLLISAIMTAPWPSAFATTVALVLCSVGFLAYSLIVFARARRQTAYIPEAEDWLWYTVFPCLVYAALSAAAMFVETFQQTSLFVIGGAALALLFIGIHNAWDTVIYLVLSTQEDNTKAGQMDSASETSAPKQC